MRPLGRVGPERHERSTTGEAPELGQRGQLSMELASYVRDLIMAGRALPGEFLRIDRLAAEVGVSHTPVREALLSLAGEGFVDWEPRRGFRVLPLRRGDVEDIIAVQAALAAELAGRAARRVDQETVEHLREVQRQLNLAARRGDSATVERLNHEFHRSVNIAADATKLTWFLSMATRYMPRRFFGAIPGWPSASVRDHALILDALIRRDADSAASTMRRHIENAGDLLLQHLGSLSEPPPSAGERPGDSDRGAFSRITFEHTNE